MLRNWHSRQSQIVQNMKDLVENAQAVAAAIERGQRGQISVLHCIHMYVLCAGDIEDIGKCLDNYRQQKLIMAPGELSSPS